MVASHARAEPIDHVEQRIDAEMPRAIDLLAELVAIDTSFPPGEGYGELADVIESWFLPLGFSFERVTIPEQLWRTRHGRERGDRINLLARMPGDSPVCAMYFHTDVVPAGSNWTTDPLVLTRRGERLIGRGTVDMKGAIAAVYAALRGLRVSTVEPAYRPHLLFCTDEEGGAYPGIRYLAEAGLIDGHLLSFNGKAAPRIWGGCFGSVDIVIEIEGRSAHSGDACDGINAVEEALPLLNRLFALKARITQRASTLAPPPDWPEGSTLNERLSIAAVHGGHKGSSLPGRCRILLNRRYAPESAFDTVMAEIRSAIVAAMAESRAVGWHMEVIGHLAPVADPTGPHWPRWQEAMAYGFGFEPGAFHKYGASSSSDMGWVQQAGIHEILLGGLVRPTSNAHGADEFTTTSDIRALARGVAAYLAADFAPSLIPDAPVATPPRRPLMNKPWLINRRTFLGGAAAGTLFAASGFPLPVLSQPRRGGTLRISVDQAPSVLNPLMHRVNPEYMLGELLYSGLTRLGPNMEPQPDLAEGWSANEDFTEWTFTLRSGVTFQNGVALTTDDVLVTLEMILDESVGSPGRRNIGPIVEVRATDERTVMIRTSGPYADLPVALAYTNAKIVPASVLREEFDSLNRVAVGTGPFRLVSYEPERQIIVERNPDYYDPERPWLDRIQMLIYPDITAEGSALIAGDTDIMMRADPTDYDRLVNAAGVVGLRTPSGQFLNVNMGCDSEPFADVRVRQALALCINREALLDFVAEGYGTIGSDTPVNSAYRYHTPIEPRRPDLERARQLLSEAGYPDGLDLTLVASDRPGTRTQLGVAFRQMAGPAGFRINVQTMPHSTYLDQVWRKGDFYVGFYNMQATADAICSLLFTSDAPWNETRWNNAEFDALIERGRRTPDGPERTEIYAQAQRLMAEETPSVIPIFFDLLAAHRDHVEGFHLHPRGAVFRLEDVWLRT